MVQYTLSELATLTGAELIGDPNHQIIGVENLDTASLHEAAFLENPRYEKQLLSSKAGVVFIQPSIAQLPAKNYLISPNPSLSFQKAIELFITSPLSGFEGIHPTACIHKEACIGAGVTVGPYAVIDRGVKIGAESVIGPGVCIGAETVVGSKCHFHAHV